MDIINNYLITIDKDYLNFTDFIILNIWYKLFFTYCNKDKVLRLKQWLRLLHDRLIPDKMRRIIDKI